MTAYPHLFSPLTLAGRNLRNRIVHASISTHFATGGAITDRLIDYYAERARGGAAMLVSEPLGMVSWQAIPDRPLARATEHLPGLRRWAAAIAGEGALFLGQVQDPGRGARSGFRNLSARGPSALPDDLSWTVPEPLSTGEVRAMIADFASSSALLAEAGFAGIEVSAGHGHLFHQFLAVRSNIREDEYGGDLAGRTRLLRDLLAAIRAACGAGFIIGLKLPADDLMPDGIGPSEAAAITALVAAEGRFDYLTYCWGSHSPSLHTHLPDNHGPRGPFVETITRLGRANAPGVPLGALGLLTDPNEGEKIVRDGAAELVMMARPLITDPAWPNKARTGREAEIRYCVSNNSCWHMITTGRTIACDNNPRVGTPGEADWLPPKVAVPHRIVVVGSGIAGLEAGWIAAARGHRVTVLGSGDEPGGKARLHARLPGGEALSSIYDYQRLAGQRHGFDLLLGSHADAAAIAALKPDLVLLATGATPAVPDWLDPEWAEAGLVPNLRDAAALFLDRTARNEGTVVIWDEDHGAFTYAAAEMLAARFDRVVIATPREAIASDESLVTRQAIYPRLGKLGVRVLTRVAPAGPPALEEGRIDFTDLDRGDTISVGDVAFLTYATQRRPNDSLAAPLEAAGIAVQRIGDCRAPRTVMAATADGHRTAMAL